MSNVTHDSHVVHWINFFFSSIETPNEGGGDQNVLFIRILNDSKNSIPGIFDFFYFSHQL